MNGRDFAGDLLLTETPDGGDCALRDGMLEADHALGTAFYLSLFGGNKADSGEVKTKNTWWDNTLAGATEKGNVIYRLQNAVTADPMTVKTLQPACEYARQRLDGPVDEGIADEINVTGRAEGKKSFRLYVQALKAGKPVYESDYGVLWGAGINGGV